MRKFILFLLAIAAGVGSGYAFSRCFGYPEREAERVLAQPRSSSRVVPSARIGSEPGAKSSSAAVQSVSDTSNPVFADGLRVRGYIVRGRRANVLLSDGTVLTERDKELQSIERNAVRIGGKKYAMVAYPERLPAQGAGGSTSPRFLVGGAAGGQQQLQRDGSGVLESDSTAAQSGAYQMDGDGVYRIRNANTGNELKPATGGPITQARGKVAPTKGVNTSRE